MRMAAAVRRVNARAARIMSRTARCMSSIAWYLWESKHGQSESELAFPKFTSLMAGNHRHVRSRPKVKDGGQVKYRRQGPSRLLRQAVEVTRGFAHLLRWACMRAYDWMGTAARACPPRLLVPSDSPAPGHVLMIALSLTVSIPIPQDTRP